MYYLLIDFKFTKDDFYADNERSVSRYLLYFYNTKEECELKYKNHKKDLLTKYNCSGKEAYNLVGDNFSYLLEDDIDYDISIVKLSE
jgi:hypothetical protein